MPFLKDRYNFLLERIIAQDQDPINQTRIKMLVIGLILNLLFAFVAMVIYSVQGPFLQFLRSIAVFAVGAGLLAATIVWPIWRKVSHTLLFFLTLFIWSNIFVFVHGTNISTLQLIFIIIVYSFYAHGTRWGLGYTLANIIPIIIYTIAGDKDYFSFHVSPQAVSRPAYLLVITYQFGLIILLHYHFFRSFTKKIVELKEAGDKLNNLNLRLQGTMQDLEKTSNARIEFLSTMSHELRTPLNGVIGLTNVLLMKDPRDDQRETLDVLKFSAENLLALINDILDYNKMSLGKIETESIPFNLAALLQNICGEPRMRCGQKGLSFIMDVDPQLANMQVVGDPTRLTQVLLNLINNAVKFTEKGAITVSATVAEKKEQLADVRFSVKDSGIGIPAEQQEDIFNPFIQASRHISRQFGGTGLGLAIVRQILETFGSRINLISAPGRGSEFFFDLRFMYQESERAAGQLSPQGGLPVEELSGMKILVAEDNAVNVLVVKKLLSMWAVEADFAGDGRVAVKMAFSKAYDLILMDLHMPEMDGYEASRTIRKNGNNGQPFIIALTASVSQDVKLKVRVAGMNDYLAKPFRPDDLLKKLIRAKQLRISFLVSRA